MNITVRQISSLEKVRREDKPDHPLVSNRTALAGERISYQLYLHTDDQACVKISVESELAAYVRIYQVRDAEMDAPTTQADSISLGFTMHPANSAAFSRLSTMTRFPAFAISS